MAVRKNTKTTRTNPEPQMGALIPTEEDVVEEETRQDGGVSENIEEGDERLIEIKLITKIGTTYYPPRCIIRQEGEARFREYSISDGETKWFPESVVDEFLRRYPDHVRKVKQ